MCGAGHTRSNIFILLLISYVLTHSSCKSKGGSRQSTLFEKLQPEYTGIHFSNTLSYDEKFNIYTYRNFYNGGGVAIGDINNDGLPDIFFTANMLPNRLFLNKGNFTFDDITEKAGIIKKGKWSTGVSMADVNGDGFLDIYVCNSGDVKGDSKVNELYINNGNATFTEKGREYGLDNRGLSTHAAFFDYDHDEDLDMFLLNNSFKAIGSFNLKENERNIRDSSGGHKFFRNDGSHFTDISEQAGIYSSIIGFGLGVSVGDVNNDGWQDIYVSNDFFERDYLYINQRNGVFREALESQMMSISNASMGADMADINNDCYPEIFVTEMLPESESRIKTNTTFESWEKYRLNLKYGYYHQFTRNILQLNNANNTFSEIGRFSGVHASDWSWGALITDLNNDGFKDIFIANGIYQDLTNADYIQYISNESFFKEVVSGKANYKKMIDLIPSNPLPNYAYSNNGDLTFTNRAIEWGLAEPGFSNGSAYGDLDNDGDLDLVVNNVNMPCFVYRNRATELNPENKYLKVSLAGEGKNRFGLGSKVMLYYNNTVSYQEQMPMRGFESTVDACMNFGLGNVDQIDSIIIRWPDGRSSRLQNIMPNQHLTIRQTEAGKASQTLDTGLTRKLFMTAPDTYGFNFRHNENTFTDFDRDKLSFHMLSTQGPRIAKGDVNGDGLEDIYICGAKEQPGAVMIQSIRGRFKHTNQEVFEKDKGCEDTDAVFFDCDKDGDQDLYVCSGGSEFSPNSTELISRLYINDGKGNFAKSPQVLPAYIFESGSCVKAADFDKDGDMDLFAGVRLKPFSYGIPCKAYILENNGQGIFRDITDKIAPALSDAGMVTDASWFDFDNDGRQDLVIAGEYMPVRIFRNAQNRFIEVTEAAGLSKSNGWWNRLLITDVNGDNYPDIVAANHGLNSRFKAGVNHPVSMYVSDFDGNGWVEQVITCYNGNSSYPMALRHDLVGVLPYLKKKYLRYENYKQQTVEDIFTPAQLINAVKLNAYTFESTVFINNRKGGFLSKPLPAEAQFSPMYAVVAEDFDADGKIDLLIGGNFYESKPEAGIYDASYGVLLKGKGNGEFIAVKEEQSGILLRGAVRDISPVTVNRKKLFIVARNNDSLTILMPGRN